MLIQELIDKISEKMGCRMKADITIKGPSDLLLHLTPANRENPRISDLTFRMHILSTHIEVKLESCAKDKTILQNRSGQSQESIFQEKIIRNGIPSV